MELEACQLLHHSSERAQARRMHSTLEGALARPSLASARRLLAGDIKRVGFQLLGRIRRTHAG